MHDRPALGPFERLIMQQVLFSYCITITITAITGESLFLTDSFSPLQEMWSSDSNQLKLDLQI